MSEFGVEAYARARKLEREANSDKMARDWKRVALVVARRMSKRGGPETRDSPASSGVRFSRRTGADRL